MKRLIFFFALCATAFGQSPPAAVDRLIPWLLSEDAELHAIPFGEVIFDATGKRVLAFDAKNADDARVLKHVTAGLDMVLAKLKAPESVIQSIPRINEVSSHFEDAMREALTTPGYRCEVPPTAEGRLMRSGYPDMRLFDETTKRVYYLDAKLFAAGSRDSSFRTFYFEPKIATNKVRDDAVHFIAGFEHEPREKDANWHFTRWDLVDLAHFKVKLKAEFQGSNHDMYRPEAIVATSAK